MKGTPWRPFLEMLKKAVDAFGKGAKKIICVSAEGYTFGSLLAAVDAAQKRCGICGHVSLRIT